MAVHYHNLDWEVPCLPGVVNFLEGLGEAAEGGPLDLRGVRAVVQTREARRRVLLGLSRRAGERGRLLFPPMVVLPEVLLEDPTVCTASRNDNLLAWTEVLKNIDPTATPRLFGDGATLQTQEQRFSWARLLVETQHLLGENLLSCADVPECSSLPPLERERWTALKALEGRFRETLKRWGLQDRTEARKNLLKHLAPAGVEHHLVLILLTDILPAAHRYLEILASSTASPEIHVLTWGPDEKQAFDKWGTPRAEFWMQSHPPQPALDEHFHSLRNVYEEALRITELVAPNESHSGAVAIGVQGGEVLSTLKRRLDLFDPSGSSLSTTSLYGLFQQLRTWLATDSFAALTQIIRHPLIFSHFSHPPFKTSLNQLLKAADDLREKHLPDSVADAEYLAGSRSPLNPIFTVFHEWHREFSQPPFTSRLQTWLDRLADSYHPTQEMREEWDAMVEALPSACQAVERTAPETMQDFLGALLALLEEETLYPVPGSAAIRADGWLELALEDAPHLILAECADEYLPGPLRAHPFLPDHLRRELGLRNKEMRLVHDTWLLACLGRSRRESGRIDYTLARNNRRGEPLKPSRLFFLGNSTELPSRVLTAFDPPVALEEDPPWAHAWQLLPPKPATRNPSWEKLSVTAFRDYLACPFRFYLKHGLGMQAHDGVKMEWDARDFGNLAHHALQRLGEDSKLSLSEDPETIGRALQDFAEKEAWRVHGKSLPLPLEIQLESLKQRLQAWAFHEAESRRQGWRIEPEGVEWKPPAEDDRYTIGGMRISGKIDRIERHAETGALRVLDFKTREKPESPHKIHLSKFNETRHGAVSPWACLDLGGKPYVWTDLQLPLYAWMLSRCFPGQDCTVGYAHLPKAAAETGVELWEDLSENSLIQSALACAEGCIRAIQEERFWPPREKVDYDDFEHLYFDYMAEAFNPKNLRIAGEGSG